MTRRPLSAALGALVSVGVGAWFVAAGAAQEQAPAPPRSGDEQNQRRAARENGPDDVRIVRASKLMGAKVIGTGGDHLGSVDNLAINTDQGRTAYLVVGFGGFLGMGDKLFAIPWPAVRVKTQDRVVLDADKEQLREMGGFRGNDWPAMAEARWLRNRPEREGRFAAAGAEERELPRYTAKGSELIGKKVRNEHGDELGTLNDLVLDPETGRIVYGVIAYGGALGVGAKLTPVPWAAFDVTEREHLRLHIDKSRFDTAPTFSNDNWSVLADSDFAQRAYSFYGQKPFWPHTSDVDRDRDRDRDRDTGRERDRDRGQP